MAVVRDISTLRRVSFKPIAKEKSDTNVIRRLLIGGEGVSEREEYKRARLLQFTVVPAPNNAKVVYNVKSGYKASTGERNYQYITLASVFAEWERLIGVSGIWNRYFPKGQKDQVIAWLPSNLRYEWSENTGILRCRVNRAENETTFSFTDDTMPNGSIFIHKDDFFDVLFDNTKVDLGALRSSSSRDTPISVSTFDYIEEIPTT